MDDDVFLIDWLSERSAKCPGCGYELTGIREPKCPECATALRLSVACSDDGLWSWIISMLAITLGIGFDSVVAALIALPILIVGGAPPHIHVFFYGLLTLDLFSIGMLIWVTRRRRAWMRLNKTPRRAIAVGIIFATFLLHAGFGGGLLYAMI
ncbi:MAG TPA: hypothetical protein ENJ00_02710 [Phycisphaerales bacterium]|nr:hypothetical protein [Phycisphaerales bacterium]